MSPLPEPTTGAISFQYLAEIAAGETARVDLCRTEDEGGRLVAIKRLHAHIAEDPQFANMFLDEVWMTASLKHKNVVEVAGWGSDDEGTYLAVELVQGVSLARLMKTVFDTGEVFSERMVVFIAAEICAGLAAAHALRTPDGEPLQLVHRDLTPGNVLVGFQGDVKIADFGLAKAKQRVTQTLTGLLKGKPQYMSPEQARGHEIDARADLFSLGVMIFELFAGRRPWSATSELQIMHVTANEPPLDLRELRPKIDKELVAIVMRCLEKDPGTRFQSAGEVRDRLVHWLHTHGYLEGGAEALGRFVRRNAMRQMRWFERAIAGELVPDANGKRHRPQAPRAPSFTGIGAAPRTTPSSIPPPPAVPRPKARVKRRRTLDPPSDSGEVTEVEARPAPFAASKVPRAKRRDTARGDIDWGEEVPTLIQKQERPIAAEIALARMKARNFVPRLPIVDEESDGRTTNVQRMMIAPAQSDDGLAKTTERLVPVRPTVPKISDMDSEDAATRPRELLAPLRREPRDAPPPPSKAEAKTEPLPGQIVGPHPSAPPPPPGGFRFNAPPLDEPSQDPGNASRTGPLPPEFGPNGAQSMARVTEEILIAEADRLATSAVLANEEALASAKRAAHCQSIAKLADAAAKLAAESVRMATTLGLAQASARLEAARAIEAALARGDIALANDLVQPAQRVEPGIGLPPSSVRPSHAPPSQSFAPPPRNPSFAPPPAHPSFVPPPAHPSFAPPPSQSFAPPANPSFLPPPPVNPSFAPPPSQLESSAGMARPSYLPGPPSGVNDSTVLDPRRMTATDDLQFRQRLQPTFLGMPVGVAVLMIGGGLFVLVIVLWLASG